VKSIWIIKINKNKDGQKISDDFKDGQKNKKQY